MARKAGITLGDLSQVAAEIADRDGLGQVTLAKVADALGVRSPSLYAHVNGIAGLRRLLQIHASAVLEKAFARAARSSHGLEAVAETARAYRRFARRHPGLLEALLPAPTAEEDPEVAEAMAGPAMVVATAVTEAGIQPDRAVDAVRYLRSSVHGFVTLENGGGFGMPEDPDQSFEALVEMVVNGLRSFVATDTPSPNTNEIGKETP